MTRFWFLLPALAAVLLTSCPASGAHRSEIIHQSVAERHGLTRSWFSQVEMDNSRGYVEHLLLDRGTLFAQTDRGMVQAMDAETGQTLWAVLVGQRNHPSLEMAANENFVAVINGSSLYILNRYNGKQLWNTQIEGAPGAGPAMSDERVYVPTVSGMVLSYLLKPMKDPRLELGLIQVDQTAEEKEALAEERRQGLRIEQEYIPPLACQSTGRALVQPIVTRQHEGEEILAWPTDRGYLFVGSINRLEQDYFRTRYRLETDAGIAAKPTYMHPDVEVVGDSGVIYAASRDGYIHAIREQSGDALWRFSTGEPLIEPAVVIGKRVFAATQPGGMYCLDARDGRQLWWVPQVIQFIAASNERVYAVDRLQRMVFLDINNGARVDAMEFPPRIVRFINDRSDRIYLANQDGLIQCLHEVELTEPVQHRKDKEDMVEQLAPTQQQGIDQLPGQEPPAGGQPADQEPFGGGMENPFGGPAKAPAPDAGLEQENPFR